VEAFGEKVIAILGAGDFDIAIAGELPGHGGEGVTVAVEDFVEAGGEEARLEAGGAADGLLGDGHALEGEQLLGVGGLVGGDEAGLEIRDLLEVFEANDGEGRRGETVAQGVAGGVGLAFGSLGSGGLGGVGAVGGELFGGDGFSGAWHDASDLSCSTGRGWSLKLISGKRLRGKGILWGDCV
jgi:hypothetical protein